MLHSIFGGNIYFGIAIFSYLSSTKPSLRFLLICFAQEIKSFYQSSFGNEVNFVNIVFPQISWLKIKFHKTETWFCRWKSNDYNNNIFLSLENPCTFLLDKEKIWKRIFNTDSELSQNHKEKCQKYNRCQKYT